jgi:hypothetical protein
LIRLHHDSARKKNGLMMLLLPRLLPPATRGRLEGLTDEDV